MKKTTRLLSTTISIVLLALVFIHRGPQAATPRAHVVILSTTDMHGRIFPIDYYTNKYDNVGITKVATLIKEARKKIGRASCRERVKNVGSSRKGRKKKVVR